MKRQRSSTKYSGSVLKRAKTNGHVNIVVEEAKEWTPQQRMALDLVQAGFSLRLLGGAGTGKSQLKTAFCQHLPKKSTFVTALTGAAAVLIGGTTLHKFAGFLRDDNEPAVSIIARVNGSFVLRRRWQQARALLIDEVSMMSAEMFVKLNAVAQAVRGNNKPLGGLQTIVLGDFLQLRSVTGTPLIHSDLFHQCIFADIVLTQVFRQKDQRLLSLLQDMRRAELSPESLETLRFLERPLPPRDGIEPTILDCLRKDVEKTNMQFLAKLPGAEVVLTAIDEFRVNMVDHQPLRDRLATECPVERDLRLKVGAQVMYRRNDSETGLMNGSRGVVIEFKDSAPVVRFLDGTELLVSRFTWMVFNPDGQTILATRSQFPLSLARAMTV